MSTTTGQQTSASRDQIIYANILLIVVIVGLLALCVTYTIYLTGLLEPLVPLTVVPEHWGKGVDEYLRITHSPTGWEWTKLLGRGDFLNFSGFIDKFDYFPR